MDENYKEKPLYKFCYEEAEYRVKEDRYNDSGDTVADILRSQYIDIDMVVKDYANILYDNADLWIKENIIQDYLEEILDDYNVE